MPKVLIVDDEPDLVQLTQTRLRSFGYEAIGAEDGESCLDKAVREMPDVILLDVMMPSMDGYEILSKLKVTEATQHIPVIMFSARVMAADIRRALRQGAYGYITKPFDPKVLRDTLRGLTSK